MVGGLMATFKVGSGIDKYISQLEDLSTSSEEMIKRSVYVGAGIVTDAVRKNIEGLPVRDSEEFVPGRMVNGVTATQKAGLLAGLGIAPFRNENGYVHVKVGMDGYNATRRKKYPNGQPNAMVARSVESGTSWMVKHPFIAPAVNATRASAEAAMAKAFDEQCKQHMEV